MIDDEIFIGLTAHILQAFKETIEKYGDTPDVHAQFFLDLLSYCFGAMATITSEESIRATADLAAEKGIEAAAIARQRQLFPAGAPQQETLQ